jgi:hypothetical protein
MPIESRRGPTWQGKNQWQESLQNLMYAAGGPASATPRIEIAVILEGLAEGMTQAEIIDHTHN